MYKTNLDTIQKVKSALLCLQRYQWEQGCVAQLLNNKGSQRVTFL